MSNYSGYIPEDLAKELLSFGMPLYKYAVGSYDGKLSFFTEDEGNSDLASCDRYRIPTYGEVMDWFSSKGIHITFNAFFTFALSENVAYLWKISFIDRSNGDVKWKIISEEDAWDSKKGYGGSFELDANDAIRYAMNMLRGFLGESPSASAMG